MTTSDADPIFLTVEEVLGLHDDQLRLFGGSSGLRDRGALESAVAVPASTFDGVHLHQDLFHMAAAYAFHIAENQPFVDGNKRTGLNVLTIARNRRNLDTEVGNRCRPKLSAVCRVCWGRT